MDDIVKNKNRGKYFTPPTPAHRALNIAPIINGSLPVEEPVFIVDGKPIDSEIGHEENPMPQQFVDNNDEYFPAYSGPKIEANNTDGEYILMISGDVVFTGSLEDTQDMLKAVIYGEHPKYTNVQTDDILILKKMAIKIGVFIVG